MSDNYLDTPSSPACDMDIVFYLVVHVVVYADQIGCNDRE